MVVVLAENLENLKTTIYTEIGQIKILILFLASERKFVINISDYKKLRIFY